MSDAPVPRLLTLRSMSRPGVVRAAIAFSGLASIAPFVLDRSLPYGVMASLTAFSAFWSSIALTTSVRFQLFRQGVAIVPGLRSRIISSSLSLGLVLWLVPLLSAALNGYSVSTMASISLAAFGVLWMLGPLFPDNQRIALSILSFAIGIDTVLFFEHTRGRQEFWIAGVDPVLQKTALFVAAIALIAWSTHRLFLLREDSWVLQRWWSRGHGDCMECSGQAGLPIWLIEVLPRFARRRLPQRDNGRTVEAELQRGLFGYSLNVLSPMGLALLYLPFVIFVTVVAAGDHDKIDLFWNPNLFLLNGLIVLFGGLNPARMRKEWMRPASRQELSDGVLAALRHDVVAFAALFLGMSFLVHLAFRASITASPVYWMGFLTAPFLMTLGYGVALWASRWTRWSGLVGFFPAWVLAALAFSVVEDDPSAQVFALCGAVSFTVAAVGWMFARAGRQYWRRVEIG